MNHTWTYNLSFGAPADPVEPRAGLSRNGHAVVAVFLGFILFFGFLNNLIVLILFCKFKTLRNPVNMLLLNISISDMLVCISGTTLSFASNIHGKWIGGEHGCRWYGFANSCFGIVSLISLAVLSYERYSTLTLCNKGSADYRKALLAVSGSWIYSLVWTVPPLIGWSSYGVEGAGTSCSVRWSSESVESTSYIICLFIFCLVIPVMVMMYCYGRLLYAVKQVGKIHKNAARKREYHVLFMVITTVICYLVCWIPYGVIALLATFGKPGVVTPVASIIPSILAKSSTVCNPIIYILMNKQLPVKFALSLFKLPPVQHPKQIFNDSFNYFPFTVVVLTGTCSFTNYRQADMTLDSLNGWHSHVAEVYQHFKYNIKPPERDLLRGLDYPKKSTAKVRAVWYILPGES